ncbi:hypothetical protein GQR58_014655 [Nymphon striatum]|nr:hypothetical protein GQR58_014655 [Nymphon striatum]
MESKYHLFEKKCFVTRSFTYCKCMEFVRICFYFIYIEPVFRNIIQWNCRCYRTKYDEICRLLNDHNPTAMCLRETRLNDTCNTTIRQYSIYRRDLPSEHPAGGVCIINKWVDHFSSKMPTRLNKHISGFLAYSILLFTMYGAGEVSNSLPCIPIPKMSERINYCRKRSEKFQECLATKGACLTDIIISLFIDNNVTYFAAATHRKLSILFVFVI